MTSAILSDRHTIIEQTFKAPVEELWALWTTRDGFEAWWGPKGFAARVHKLDLRPGGELRYSMIAVGTAQILCLQQAGLPLTTHARIAFTRIALRNSIAYMHRVDFVPGVEPYDVANTVEFHRESDGVRMVVKQAPMHNDEWTQRAWNGMKSQIGRIPAALARYQLA